MMKFLIASAGYQQKARGIPMNLKLVLAAAAAAATLGLGAQAQAGTVVFSDNFNSYAFQLNWAPPANWTAPGPGTVDLIGETTSGTDFDFFPGNGGFVDLDGSNGLPGTLQTNAAFAAGTYTLTFDLGGNARGDVAKTTDITLGNFHTALTLTSSDPLALHSFTFTTTGGQLSFSDLPGGNQDIGNILDNVALTSGVPEPATWAMMLLGVGLVGAGLRIGRLKDAALTAA
jgi:hypothetical protein